MMRRGVMPLYHLTADWRFAKPTEVKGVRSAEER
jgi:hypothetical protein